MAQGENDAQEPCDHERLILEPCSASAATGYVRPTLEKRLAAANTSGRVKAGQQKPSPTTFPGPLVLPDDELALDPGYPPQTVLSWKRLKERNPVTRERQTIYVVAPPAVEEDVEFIKRWRLPNPRDPNNCDLIGGLDIDYITTYLSAFFHPCPIKILSEPLRFVRWGEEPVETPEYVGLAVGDDVTRIQARHCEGPRFSHQLNLNDMLDVALSILPTDAYSIVMLTDHDIFEDAEDDFCCGRAYGSSRIAIVSTARYNPHLDSYQGVQPYHTWPASHCVDYTSGLCNNSRQMSCSKLRASAVIRNPSFASPLSQAVSAFAQRKALRQYEKDCRALHLFRTIRTVVHELLHTFGLDHCVFYACLMQGTASVQEDARQPPYLCPICTAKLDLAVDQLKPLGEASTKVVGKSDQERCQRLLDIITTGALVDRADEEHRDSLLGDGSWHAWAAWLKRRLLELERSDEEDMDL